MGPTADDAGLRSVDPDLLPLHRQPVALLAVGAGGGLGTVARYGVGLALPTGAYGFPTATLSINLTGSFALGLLVEVLVRRARPGTVLARHGRAFAGAGFLGGWTTYSTFAVEVVRLGDGGRGGVAVAYALVSVLGGLLAATAGLALGRRAG